MQLVFNHYYCTAKTADDLVCSQVTSQGVNMLWGAVFTLQFLLRAILTS